MYDPSNYKQGLIVQQALELEIEINALYSFIGFCINKPLHSVFSVTDDPEFLMLEENLLPLSNAYRLINRKPSFFSLLIPSKGIMTPAIATFPDEPSKALITALGVEKVTFQSFTVKLGTRPLEKVVQFQQALMSVGVNVPSMLIPTHFDSGAEDLLESHEPNSKLEAILNILYWIKVFGGVTRHNGVITGAIAQEALEWYETDLINSERFFTLQEV